MAAVPVLPDADQLKHWLESREAEDDEEAAPHMTEVLEKLRKHIIEDVKECSYSEWILRVEPLGIYFTTRTGKESTRYFYKIPTISTISMGRRHMARDYLIRAFRKSGYRVTKIRSQDDAHDSFDEYLIAVPTERY